MRHRYIWGAVLAAVVAIGWPTSASAQDGGGSQVPLNADPVIPIPTGQAGQAGFYTSGEFVMLFQSKAIGQQTIAQRGFIDSSGQITGIPGTFLGPGTTALATNQLGSGGTGMPGLRIEVGYKFDTGVRLYANYMQVYDAHYSAGATLVPPGFRTGADQAGSFLTSPVYGFTNAFGGPQFDTAFDSAPNGGFNTFGIWNAADVMDIKFVQRYQQAEAGLRTPLFATDYSSVYSLAGARFAWFFERFTWLTPWTSTTPATSRSRASPTTPTPCRSGCTVCSSGAGTRCTWGTCSRPAST